MFGQIQRLVSHTKKRSKVYINIRLHPLSFRGTAPHLSEHSVLYLHLYGHFTTLCVHLHIKINRRVSTHFWCLSNNLQPPWDILKYATVHDETCVCMHWFSCRPFWAFVMNCELINSTNSTVIKLIKCHVNIPSVVSKVLHS